MMDLETFHKQSKSWETRSYLPQIKGGKLQIELGEQALIKSWKEGALADQHQPLWKGPYPVTLVTPMAVKVQE
jgi:hypothetical protein